MNFQIKKITIMLLILIISLGLLLSGCENNNDKTSQGVIVTSPEVAEIIAELGGIDKIIARTEYCDYPQKMLDIESVGDFSSIDIERVIELKPQIIFTAAFEQQEFFDKLQPFGIEVVKIHSNSFASYYDNVQLIADKLGLQEMAPRLITDFKKAIANLTLPTNPPKVYFEISSNLGTVTNNSFIGELIIRAGGLNIFGDLNKDFFIAKNEDVVQANPDVIIALSYLSKADVSQRRGWQNIAAVQKGNIYTIEDIDIDTVMRTIPRSTQALQKFNQWFLEYDKK